MTWKDNGVRVKLHQKTQQNTITAIRMSEVSCR